MKETVHIFVLGSCFPAELGGPSNTIFQQAQALSDNNFKVKIFSTMAGITKEHKKKYSIVENKETLIKGVKITFFKQYTSQKISPLLLQEIKVLNSRYKIIIHLNSVFFPLNLIICLFLFLYNVSFTIAPRGELIPQALSIKPIRKKLLMPFVKKVLKKASKIIITNKAELEGIHVNEPSKIKVLPNYMKLPSALNLTKKKQLLFLGRINRIKCIDNLILAFSKSRCIQNHELLIVGDGDSRYLNELKDIVKNNNISDKVTFQGAIFGDEKFKVYSESRLLILPSKSENFGNVVIEALSQKTPVIACYNSPWKILEDEKCGFFTSNSIESLKKAMNSYHDLETLDYEEMSKNAECVYIEKFSREKNIDLICRTYDD